MRECNDRMSLAWHIAALQRRERLPSLSSMQIKKSKPQTWQQQLAIAKQWDAVINASSKGH